MVSRPTTDRAAPHRDIGRVVSQRPCRRVIPRRQIKRALRFARPLLVQQLGGAAAAAVQGRLLEQYAAVAPAVPRLRSPMSRMTLRIAVDALALYRSLPADLASDQKLALISRFVTDWMQGQFDSVLARWVYAHRIPHLLLRRWWFWTANLLDEPGGWRFRFAKDGPGLFYAVDVTRCGIVRFLTAEGAPSWRRCCAGATTRSASTSRQG